MSRVPVCFKFCPTERELVELYLTPKAKGLALPDGHQILERSLYGDEAAAPWKVFSDEDPWQYVDDTMEKKIIYVFTKVIAKYGKSKRMARNTGCGTWHIESGKEVRDSKRNVIAYKRWFKFKPKEEFENEMRGKWIMYEYSLKKPDECKDGDVVVCRISNQVQREGLGNNSDASSNSVERTSEGNGNKRVRREGVSTDQMGNCGRVVGGDTLGPSANVSRDLPLSNQAIVSPSWGFAPQNESQEVVMYPAATSQDLCQECARVVGVVTLGPSTNVSRDLRFCNQEIVFPNRGFAPQNESQKFVPYPAATYQYPYSSDANERSTPICTFFSGEGVSKKRL